MVGEISKGEREMLSKIVLRRLDGSTLEIVRDDFIQHILDNLDSLKTRKPNNWELFIRAVKDGRDDVVRMIARRAGDSFFQKELLDEIKYNESNKKLLTECIKEAVDLFIELRKEEFK